MRKVKKDFTGFNFNYPVSDFFVEDGDTIECVLDLGFRNTKKASVRLNGVYAPDVRSVDDVESKAGLAVKYSVIGWMKKGIPHLACTSVTMDKIEGRILGSIYNYQTKSDLSTYLLSSDFALSFNGSGPKPVFTRTHLQRIVDRRSEEETSICRSFLMNHFTAGESLVGMSQRSIIPVASGEQLDTRDVGYILSLDRGYVEYYGTDDDLTITDKGRKLIASQEWRL